MTNNKTKKNHLLWAILILGMAAYGQKYSILPSVVIESKNGIVTRYEDDVFAIDNKCMYIVEIKDSQLLVYHFNAEIKSAREDKSLTPEIFFISFAPSNFEGKTFFSGDNKNSRYVEGYIDTGNKDGSLCVYNSSGICLYIAFEYVLES